MSDHDNPTQDAELARSALAQGDLPHAIHHIGCALVGDPTNAEWTAILDEIIQRSPDALGLVPIHDGVDFVTAATRAYVQAATGNLPDAVSLLGNVAKTRPDVPFLAWAVRWLQQAGGARALSFDDFMSALGAPIMRLAFGCPSPMDSDDPRRPNVQHGLTLFQMARSAFPTESVIFYGESICCRRLGRFDEALPLAEHALALDPAWRNCVAVAQVYRDMGRIDDAVGYFKKALDYDPEDTSAWMDIGDLYLDAERYREAQEAYGNVLRKEPDNAWASASVTYCRYRSEGEPLALALALLRARDGDDGDRANQLFKRIEPPMEWVNWIPRAGDASCNAMRDIFERMYENPAEHHGSQVSLRLSHPEAPSVVTAFRLQMEMWGPHVGLVYEVDTVPQPDPRQPVAQIEYPLWVWKDGLPVPQIPTPDPAVARAVFELCEEPFHLWKVWGPRAAEIAQRLGPGALQSLLGCMVHPPRPPRSSYRVLMWVQRVQLAAALIIAHLDGGWSHSLRQRALYSLVYGPVNWSVNAGIVALAYLGRTDPAIRADVNQVFSWLASQVPRDGFTCFEYALAAAWLHMGGHDSGTQASLEGWIDRIVDGKTQSGSRVTGLELGPKPFDQAAEMAAAQEARAAIASGDGGDPDPVVFPGQAVPRLSDYVRLMKGMQTGDMMGALGQFGLDMMTYGSVATAWGQKLAADPTLNARFSQMMVG